MIKEIKILEPLNQENIGVLDCVSVIWHEEYYGTGDFELYVPATARNIEMLVEGNLVKRDDRDIVGIIESIEKEHSVDNGIMLVVSGRMVKSILDRRHIYHLSGHTNKPTLLRQRVETAIRQLVYDNAINCTWNTNRNMEDLSLGTFHEYPEMIVDTDGDDADKQVSFDNLLEYTDKVLKEYQLSSKIYLTRFDGFKFEVVKGVDRSVDNIDGNEPVIFSIGYDNLTESNFKVDVATEKNTALVGGAGQDVDRFFIMVNDDKSGLERKETFIDASSINKEYEDSGGQKHTYTDAEYTKMLNTKGKQELAQKIINESFESKMNVNGGTWKINEHYFLGDIVTFQDDSLEIYTDCRLVETTETQDENGYNIEPKMEVLKIVE